MKRVIPLLLALLLLTACGVPAAEPSPTPSATPLSSSPNDIVVFTRPPAPFVGESDTARAMPDTLTLPTTEFTPVSYWLAEPYGEGGQALLIAGEDGAFKCWYSDWGYLADLNAYELETGCVTETEAQISIDGDALTLACENDGFACSPESFRRVSREDAIRAHRDMPFNDEIVLPMARRISREELEAMPGVEFVSEEYGHGGIVYTLPGVTLYFDPGTDWELILAYFTTANPDLVPEVRDITLGTALDDILSVLPDGPKSAVYGDDSGQIYGGFYAGANISERSDADEYRGQDQLTVYSRGQSLKYILDENNKVEAIICYLN